jgi:hypothetical protein
MQIPITLGTTNIIQPDTPDLAGRPTCKKKEAIHIRKLMSEYKSCLTPNEKIFSDNMHGEIQ